MSAYSTLSTLFRRLKGTEDSPLLDYELETLKMIRASSFRLRWKSTESLCWAYREWSSIEYCAGWMDPSPGLIKSFVKWATTPPIDHGP